jgi:hypothetical protein
MKKEIIFNALPCGIRNRFKANYTGPYHIRTADFLDVSLLYACGAYSLPLCYPLRSKINKRIERQIKENSILRKSKGHRKIEG